ncbi:MAG TPA: molybdopterin-dependent oxidoreductase, partial [Bryobacteraceae bacterium]|nr:molybdopterin-dependent oxidoreductase [Bryobacteraceae bacterium]
AKRVVTTAAGEELRSLEQLRADLAAESELVILFGDAVKGSGVSDLVAFGDSLGTPVKYVCLLDYSNSRGAQDWGLLPGADGMNLDQMLAAEDLDALWVIGANPLKSGRTLAAASAFVVVNDLFLTETARRADVILPAASQYEKSGTVTNVCGEVQRLKRGIEKSGAKADLEIFGMVARAMRLELAESAPPAVGDVTSDGIHSACDTLYTSGTTGRYSKMLNAVKEGPGELYKGGRA